MIICRMVKEWAFLIYNGDRLVFLGLKQNKSWNNLFILDETTAE